MAPHLTLIVVHGILGHWGHKLLLGRGTSPTLWGTAAATAAAGLHRPTGRACDGMGTRQSVLIALH